MERFHIQGGRTLHGSIEASGAKNAALPALAASLLTDEPLRLENVPRVRDIETMLRLLDHLGVANRTLEGAVVLEPRDGAGAEAPYELVKTMRASVLVLGPLLARRCRARVSLPGGCAIGVRPIDQHLAGLAALGAEIRLEHGYVEARCSRLVGGRFRFQLPTVGGTENLLMAAALARGTTVLDNCALEPEVVDLARLLERMGAQIEGAGTRRIVVEGVASLGGGEHAVIPDRIEAGTYLIAGALTRGEVEVGGARAADLAPLLEKLTAAGADVDADSSRIRIRGCARPTCQEIVTAPHPGFPTDLQAQLMVFMTQAEGVSTIRETVFENRFQHVPELVRMGADIRVDGREAQVHGPRSLSGARVMATDLRASACLILAGLAAEGETVVDRVYHLDRGYEGMELKLQRLGARVERAS